MLSTKLPKLYHLQSYRELTPLLQNRQQRFRHLLLLPDKQDCTKQLHNSTKYQQQFHYIFSLDTLQLSKTSGRKSFD